MSNNICVIILIIILVVGIIWFLNQPKPFMRLRHKKTIVGGEEPELGDDQQMGCCEIQLGDGPHSDGTYKGLMTEDNCIQYCSRVDLRPGWMCSTSFDANVPKDQCHD